jgi:hypothetical protein
MACDEYPSQIDDICSDIYNDYSWFRLVPCWNIFIMVTTADIKGKFMLNLCTDQIYKTQYSKLNRPARQWSSISRQIWLNWLRSRPIPEANSWYFKAYSMKHLQVDYFRLSFNFKIFFGSYRAKISLLLSETIASSSS